MTPVQELFEYKGSARRALATGCDSAVAKVQKRICWMIAVMAIAVLPGFTQTRIMPLGDSITEGTGSSGGGLRGYRRPLWQALEADFLVDFVGSLSDGDNSFDQDHEGHAGWSATQIRSAIDNFLQISDPEMILLHIGTNDISANRTAQDIVDDIDATLEAIYGARSTNRVFLCAIIPRKDGNDPQTQSLNDEIVKLANIRSANGDRINLVDMHEQFASVSNWETALMADNLHPNDAGYALMAETFFDAIAPYLNPVVPVELISFEASLQRQEVVLEWSTASETNNFGFFVEHKSGEQIFSTRGFIPGHGTTTLPQSYRFVDVAPEPGVNFYRLRQVDSNGTFEFSNVIRVINLPPKSFSLRQNYPNPFNIDTKISFELPSRSFVRLTIFEVNGREVVTLFEGERAAGIHEINWNSRDAGGNVMPNGVYYFRLESGGQQAAKAMSLVR